MASGFSGGGPEFFAEITGRSVNNMNPNPNNMTQNPYRITNPQLSRIFLDQTTTHQIAPQRATASSNFTSPTSIGKRTLADFQHQNNLQQGLNPALRNLLLRSVKPRMYQNTWPVEFSNNSMISPEVPSFSSQHRYGLPLLQQLGRNPINLNPQSIPPSLPYMNALQQQQQSRGVGGGGVVGPQDSEKKMMNQLQELEKQLLDDNDDGADDTVSVITSSNSEWSDTIQSIINISTSSTNPVAPSPTSSSSSSSSTNSILNCSRQTVLEAASAISEGKTELATEILTRISHASNAKGNTEQKLMDYMLTSLKSRVNPVDNPPPVRELYSKEHVASTHLLYELSPCFKQSFMAANSAILDATLDPNNSSNAFHVIDFDIGQGTQCGLLLYALSERLNGKTAIVKVTAVPDNGADEERLRAVGDKLSQLGERLRISLRFNVVSCKLSDLNRDSLGCEPEEVLAVNFAFKLFRMPDESVSMENPRDELLRRVKRLSPRVVTLVEQEMNGNTAPFLTRVNEACAYYGPLLESIESSVPKESSNSERVKAVEAALCRKLANSVACEGRDRVERCEVFGKWRARMGMAGFELKPMNQTDVESIKSSMGSANRPNPGYSITEQNGGVWFGWMGKTLAVASAWR